MLCQVSVDVAKRLLLFVLRMLFVKLVAHRARSRIICEINVIGISVVVVFTFFADITVTVIDEQFFPVLLSLMLLVVPGILRPSWGKEFVPRATPDLRQVSEESLGSH